MTAAATHNLPVWSSPAKLLLPHPLSVNSATRVFLVSTHVLRIADRYTKAGLNTGNVSSTSPFSRTATIIAMAQTTNGPKFPVLSLLLLTWQPQRMDEQYT